MGKPVLRREVSAIELKENEVLAGISKEYHTRRQNGKLLAWIIEDKLYQYCILSQKISSACEFLNGSVLADESRADKVSVAALYQISTCSCDERSSTQGYSKHRWRCRPYVLGEAADVFNTMRSERPYDKSVIVGTSNCYRITA